MSNIPLPALAVQPPQNALEEYARVAQIGGQIQNQKLQSQEIQLRQQEIADQDATTQAMREWDPKSQNYDDLSDLVLKHGGSAKAATGMQLHGLDVQTKAAALSKDKLANFKSQMETIGNDMEGLADPNTTSDADLHDAARNHVVKYIQNGFLPKEEGMQLLQHINNTDDPTVLRGAIDAFGKQHMGAAAVAGLQKTQNEATEAAQKTKQSKAETEKAETENKVKQLELSFGGPPEVQEARYMNVLNKMKTDPKNVDPKELAAAMAYEASKQTSHQTSDTLGVITTQHGGPTALSDLVKKNPQSVSSTPINSGTPTAKSKPAAPVDTGYNPAGGGTTTRKYSDLGLSPEQQINDKIDINKLTPTQIKTSIADLIGTYHADPTLLSRMLFHHPETLALIHLKYPDWDETSYNAKNAMVKNMTSGPQSKEINAINTAMGHAKIADDAIDGLNNGNLTKLNQIGNYIGVNVTGQTAPAAFKTIIHKLGPEVTSAYIPGAGGQNERITNENDFNENLPPQTLHNNLAVTTQMLRSKLGSLENQYKNTVMRDDFQKRFITPEAAASFKKFEGQGINKPPASGGKALSNFSVIDPRGHTHYFKDQASADSFKQDAGIK